MVILGENLSRLVFGSGHEKTSSQSFAHDDAIKIANGLSKVASMEVSPSTYPSLIEVMKIASSCIMSMDVELESIRKEAQVRIILDDMINNGLTGDEDLVEKVAELKSKSNEELNTYREAIKLSYFMRDGGDLFQTSNDSINSSPAKRGMFEGVVS